MKSAASSRRAQAVLASLTILGAAVLPFVFTGCPFFDCPDEDSLLVQFGNVLPPPLIAFPGERIVLDSAGNRYVLGSVRASGGRQDFNPRGGKDVQDVVAGSALGLRTTHYVTRLNPDESYGWTALPASHGDGAIAVTGGRVYVAGTANPGPADREQPLTVTAFLATTGEVTGFGELHIGRDINTLGEPAIVTAMVVSADGETLFIAAKMPSTAIEPAKWVIHAIHAHMGLPLGGFGDTPDHVVVMPGRIEALVATGSRLYALGDFDTDVDREDASVVALDARTGAVDTSFGSGRVTFGSSTGRAFGRALAVSPDGLTIYAAGGFQGTGFGFGNVIAAPGFFSSTVDGIDTDDFDSFVIALDAQTGAPRQGFGVDTTSDGQGDGVQVFSDVRLNLCKDLAAQGTGANAGLLLLANSPRLAHHGLVAAEPDVFIARLHAASGALDTAFGANGIQSFGGSASDTASDGALAGDRLVLTGAIASSDAGVGGRGNLGDSFSGVSRGFVLELDLATGRGLNAGPRIFDLSPREATAGSPGFNLLVQGARFTPRSVVYWNDFERQTTFVDESTLAAAIPASDVATAGIARLSVFEPDDDQFDFNDVFSNVVIFEIVGRGDAPVLTSLDPESSPLGGHGSFLTVHGSGFEVGTLVLWDGVPRFTVVSQDQLELTTLIQQADLALAGNHVIQAKNPGSGPSNSLRLAVGNPVVNEIAPARVTAGGPAFVLNVRGDRFTPSSIVLFNGVSRSTNFIDGGLLQAAISASDIAGPARMGIVVDTPGSGRSLESIILTITAPGIAPFIEALRPTAVQSGGGGFLLTVFGNFLTGAEVLWNGSPRPTTFAINPARLVAQISAQDVALGGETGGADIALRNPDGQTSDAVRFIVGSPQLDELQPSSAGAGGAGFPLMAIGKRFAIDATIRWNGLLLQDTRYVSPTQVMVMIPQSFIEQPATVTVDLVQNDFGTPSNTRDFIITAQPAAAFPSSAAVPADRHTTRDLRVRDRDRDGWIDDIERAFGSSPESAASTPFGIRAAPKIATMDGLGPLLRTRRRAHGHLVLAGLLPMPEDFDPKAQPVYVFADGKLRSFALNEHGTSRRQAHEQFRVNMPPRRGAERRHEGQFVLQLDAGRSVGPVVVLFGQTLHYLPAPSPAP